LFQSAPARKKICVLPCAHCSPVKDEEGKRREGKKKKEKTPVSKIRESIICLQKD